MSKAEYIVLQLNVKNAKKIALLLVIGFIIYHGLIHSDSCSWLLSKGRYKGDKEWQPFGCMMHDYTETDTRRCLRYLAFWGKTNHFVFIGDSTIRHLYQAFINHLQPNNESVQSTKTKNLEFVDYKLRLRVNYIYANEISTVMLNEFTKWQTDADPPSTIIASCTYANFLHGNFTEELQKSYAMNLTRLVKLFDNLVAKKSKVLWKILDPVDEDKTSETWKNVVNDDIDRYNQIVYEILGISKVQIWASSRLISAGLMNEMIDGHLLGEAALRHDLQILLNMYCNDNMNYNDGSCCSTAESYTILQVVTYSVFGVCIVLALALMLRKLYYKLSGQTLYMPLNQTIINVHDTAATDISTLDSDSNPIIALCILGLIMGYFYLCDRTNFFMKENKYYSEFSFWIPVGYVFALGLFFTEDSKFTKVLHRDQTDELKGWMQLVILIYYMTGASSRVLPIYMHIKMLISCYIFLLGYSQFTHMWQTGGKAGLIRFLQVLFRINFMTIVLCLCMNRPYQFYFFVPLISFWFCVISFVLYLPPRISAHNCDNNSYQYLYLVLKFVGILSVVTISYMSEVFFERIFVTRPWKALFVTIDDDIHEWFYRWKLDRYTVTYGMIMAAVLHLAQKFNIFDDNNNGNLFSRRISLTATLAAILGIGSYTTYTFLCRNKQDCEEIHSYVVFIPIIGYIVLRNISGILRTRFSAFFAWFGRISLELFICQYHIWLAADRHGVLVLLPGYPTQNVILTTFIFVCISHEVHRLTQVLSKFFVPNDWKLALRNFVIFLVVLIPIGRHDGMI